MPGIYMMAVLTILATALLCTVTLNQYTRSDRRYYWLIVAGLPLSLIVNRFVKTPFITALAAWTGLPLRIGLDVPVWFILAVWLNSPVFEEAIKMLPLILPASRPRARIVHPLKGDRVGIAEKIICLTPATF